MSAMLDLFALAKPVLHALPPEPAHTLTIASLRAGLGPRDRAPDDPILSVTAFGRQFANPLGMAAGFDKNARVIAAVFGIGFGFVEIGTVTPRPQAGNPKPRMVRVPGRSALINRLGFNNAGAVVVGRRLARCRRPGPVGVNLGRNRDSADPIDDYVQGVRDLGPLADYLAINVSSPNTPGLRDLQRQESLAPLLTAVLGARDASAAGVPVLLKIAPDLEAADRDAIAQAALTCGVDGLIVANTTVSRPEDVPADLAREAGGLSGPPVMALSTALLADMRRRLGPAMPMIGVGGVASADDAYAKIRAGACLVQLYTALAYHGPKLVRRIKGGLADRLRRDGFSDIMQAVGSAV